MSDVLLALALLVASALAVAAGATAVLLWVLFRRNRVHPRSRNGAPVLWLASPALAARHHRRLRAAVHLTLAERTWPAVLDDERDQLHAHAISLDADLIRLARLPRAERRRQLRAVTPEVARVESTAVRLAGLARPTGERQSDRSHDLDRLAERIELVEAARDELRSAVGPRRVGTRLATPARDEATLAPPARAAADAR